MDEIIRAEDLSVYEKRRRELKELLGGAAKVSTPDSAVEQNEGQPFPTVKFEYLNAQADEFHPRRSITIVTDRFNDKFIGYEFTVLVTDLETGESRPGTGFHPVIAFEKNSTKEKHVKDIRQQMNNARKAALTLAVRDAYAHFGIAADYYGMAVAGPPTEEQRGRLELIFEPVNQLLSSDVFPMEKAQSIEDWLTKQRDKFEQCTAANADKFLDKLETSIKERLNAGK